jgi:hypothetical protein
MEKLKKKSSKPPTSYKFSDYGPKELKSPFGGHNLGRNPQPYNHHIVG